MHGQSDFGKISDREVLPAIDGISLPHPEFGVGSGMAWQRKRDWKLEQHKRQLVGVWRGGIQPARPVREGKSLDEILPSLLKGLKLEEAVAGEEILAAWHGVVGELRARYSRPDQLKNGILYVNVIQPTVRFEMEGMKSKFLKDLQERFGEKAVKKIELRHGS